MNLYNLSVLLNKTNFKKGLEIFVTLSLFDCEVCVIRFVILIILHLTSNLLHFIAGLFGRE